MKLNMKRVVLGLSVAVCLFSLSACSKADTESNEIDTNVQAQMEQLPGSFLELYTGLEDSQVADFKKNMEMQEQYAALAEGVDSWLNVKDELGTFVSAEDTAKVEELEGGYSATINTVFEKREMEFSITTDSKLSKITGVSFAPRYTFKEKMVKALFNTVMGMGTVFLVLIFISILISGFKTINAFETKMKNKSNAAIPSPVPAPAGSAPEAEETEDLTDDLELAAVITAAIAASTGSSPSGLVVRSIRRAPAGKWKKA